MFISGSIYFNTAYLSLFIVEGKTVGDVYLYFFDQKQVSNKWETIKTLSNMLM